MNINSSNSPHNKFKIAAIIELLALIIIIKIIIIKIFFHNNRDQIHRLK
jgi:hypothetical protein